MEPFSPVKVTPAQVRELQEAVNSATPKGKKTPKVIAGELFTPWQPANENTIESASNVAIGGDNWPPSSFDPANDYYYVCSQSGAVALQPRDVEDQEEGIQGRRNLHGEQPDARLPRVRHAGLPDGL